MDALFYPFLRAEASAFLSMPPWEGSLVPSTASPTSWGNRRFRPGWEHQGLSRNPRRAAFPWQQERLPVPKATPPLALQRLRCCVLIFASEEYWVKNGLIPAGEFYQRKRASTEDTGSRQYAGSRGVEPSLLEPDGSCRPRTACRVERWGLSCARIARGRSPGRLGLARIWGVCHSTAEGGVAWSENLHRCGSASHYTDLSLGSARPESESSGSIVLSMGRRRGKLVKTIVNLKKKKKSPEALFVKESVILALTLSCLWFWRD